MSVNGYTSWALYLFDERKQEMMNMGGQAVIMNPNLPTKPNLYADSRGTALANPVTFVNGVAKFYTLDSITAVDACVVAATGEGKILKGTTPGQTRVEMDAEEPSYIIAIPFNTGDAGAISSGVQLPANVIIDEAFVRVTTASAAKTINAGWLAAEGGAGTEFLNAESTAAAGVPALNALALLADGVKKTIEYACSAAGAAGYIGLRYRKFI